MATVSTSYGASGGPGEGGRVMGGDGSMGWKQCNGRGCGGGGGGGARGRSACRRTEPKLLGREDERPLGIGCGGGKTAVSKPARTPERLRRWRQRHSIRRSDGPTETAPCGTRDNSWVGFSGLTGIRVSRVLAGRAAVGSPGPSSALGGPSLGGPSLGGPAAPSAAESSARLASRRLRRGGAGQLSAAAVENGVLHSCEP